MYTNIPQDDGLEFCREALESRTDKSIPTSFLTELLNICLKNNIFEFGGKLYKQLIGTAMGIDPDPSYANIIMAKLDDRIVKLANTYKIADEFAANQTLGMQKSISRKVALKKVEKKEKPD